MFSRIGPPLRMGNRIFRSRSALPEHLFRPSQRIRNLSDDISGFILDLNIASPIRLVKSTKKPSFLPKPARQDHKLFVQEFQFEMEE